MILGIFNKSIFLKIKDYRQIVDSFGKQVLNICNKFLNNAEDSKDVSQEVFLEVYYSLHKFREESKLSTWIYRIAVNKSLDFLKKQKRHKRFAFYKILLGNDDENVSDNLTPQSILEESERWKILNKALSELPEKQLKAISLSRMESLSSKQIAEIMEIKSTAVDMLISRAKQNLRKKLCIHFDKFFS